MPPTDDSASDSEAADGDHMSASTSSSTPNEASCTLDGPTDLTSQTPNLRASDAPAPPTDGHDRAPTSVVGVSRRAELAIPRQPVDVSRLTLPRCMTPRPGDRVVWFYKSHQDRGVLLGHNWQGQPIVRLDDDRGDELLPSFSTIRLEDPASAVGPNWTTATAPFKTVMATDEEQSTWATLLSQRVSPGPRTQDLISEIYARGFEVFIVGGAVRDVLRGESPNDLDIATTMPIAALADTLRMMYELSSERINPKERMCGYLRLGAHGDNVDPSLDVTAFRLKKPCDDKAVFSNRFDMDLSHRDFACNALYYDPHNKAIHDPSGRGIADCAQSRLKLVVNTNRAQADFKAYVVIRSAKFYCAGFTAEPGDLPILSDWARTVLPVLDSSVRKGYIFGQLLDGVLESDFEDHVTKIQRFFAMLDAGQQCRDFIEPMWAAGAHR